MDEIEQLLILQDRDQKIKAGAAARAPGPVLRRPTAEQRTRAWVWGTFDGYIVLINTCGSCAVAKSM